MSIHIVRHAKAGDRAEWDGPDERRPLSKAGIRQAGALVELFGDAPLKRVLTSRYRRCVDTVAPLAQHLGLDVEEHPALAEEASIDAVWALLEDLTGTEAVVCTHGNLIGPILDRLDRRGVEWVDDRWTCKKGSSWTIEEGTDGTFTRAHYTPPLR
jgi:8-oxo-dGTP diphosphatase